MNEYLFFFYIIYRKLFKKEMISWQKGSNCRRNSSALIYSDYKINKYRFL